MKKYEVTNIETWNGDKQSIFVSNHNYAIMSFWELPAKYQKIAKKNFDYLGENMEETSGYFIFRDELYNLVDFVRFDKVYKYGKKSAFHAHGAMGDSFFSSTIIQLSEDCESCKIAVICC